MDSAYQQLNDYTHYLEGQLEKFSAFMLTQKKLNEKHTLIGGVIDEIMGKMQKIQDKIKLIEINQKDNLYEIKKIRAEKEVLKSMEIRIQNMQHELSSLFKSQQRMPRYERHNCQSQEIIQENQKIKAPQQKDSKKNFTQLSSQNLGQIEKFLSSVFVNKQAVQQIIVKTKDEIEFSVKKLQIEVDKNKEFFLKLISQINNLSNRSHFQTPFQKQLKIEKRLHTQSTKNLNTQFSNEKGLKFKRIKQKYNRLSAQTIDQHLNRSQRISERKSLSYRKVGLFNNEMLRQNHRLENGEVKNKNKPQRKYLQLSKGSERVINSKNLNKKMPKTKSPDRIKKFNQDYMISS